MSEKFHLKIERASGASNADNLRHIFRTVEELGQREAWPDSLVFKVNLVLEELGLNILSYGGASSEETPEIEIVITSEDHALTIEVSDDGFPFDPLNDAPKPNVDGAIEERSVGGLGVYLVQTLMEDLSYQRTAGKNRLTMVARRD